MPDDHEISALENNYHQLILPRDLPAIILKKPATMFLQSKLTNVCLFKLYESYDTLYDLQHRLKISDEYLMSTIRDPKQDCPLKESLEKLLQASKVTRDNLITWYLKQTLAQLHSTISLLTAKIKFIEYKLNLCEGIDLHQACSLSLVDFCNILADMTVVNVPKSKKKTMHQVSTQVGIPIWLSHYRNQICHIPSESPCISILVPLVIKSLDYIKESFWAKIIHRDAFDAQNCIDLVETISNYANLTTINQYVEIRKDIELTKRAYKIAKKDKFKCKKACILLRASLEKTPKQVLDVILDQIVACKPEDKSKNCSLLLEQVILSRNLEKFIHRLMDYLEERVYDKIAYRWLFRIIELIGFRTKEEIKKGLKSLDLNVSVKLRRSSEITPLKCTRIAYRLAKLDGPIVLGLIKALRHKLLPILGKERTLLFMRLTSISKRGSVN